MPASQTSDLLPADSIVDSKLFVQHSAGIPMTDYPLSTLNGSFLNLHKLDLMVFGWIR